MSSNDPRLNRRAFVELSATALAGTLLGCGSSPGAPAHPALLEKPTDAAMKPSADAARVTYFSRFGVDEGMIREALGTAMSRGGDHADLFFQHRVRNNLTLEDGEVNRAFSQVELGVGVRVVKGDQTGYGYTEELTRDALKRAAETAAAVADGPSRPAPQSFRADSLPQRYPLRVAWDAVKPEQKLPIMTGVNAAALKMDPRVKKVTIFLADDNP